MRTLQQNLTIPCISAALLIVAIAWAMRPIHAEEAAEGAPTAAPTAAAPTSADLAMWIDGRVARHFAESGRPEPALVDDATFLRRVYLDLHGAIPPTSRVRDFLDDPATDKRFALVDQLLKDDRYYAHMARTWRRIFLPGNAQTAATGVAFEAWLREQLAANAPFDAMIRQIVTAGGAEERDESDSRDRRNGGDRRDRDDDDRQNSGAIAYLQAAGADPASVAGAISRDFLGVRIECAQCHDHPTADWKQDKFWGVAAFFAGASFNQPVVQDANRRRERPRDQRVATISPPDIGKTFSAEFLWNDEPVADENDRLPRQVFAEWLTSAENSHFAATAVNRVWRQLCGRGLTQSVDDLDAATENERAVVLDELAKRFAGAGFDVTWLVGGICKSRAYQFEASGSPESSELVGVRPLKTLSPEQVFDALETAGTPPSWGRTSTGRATFVKR